MMLQLTPLANREPTILFTYLAELLKAVARLYVEEQKKQTVQEHLLIIVTLIMAFPMEHVVHLAHQVAVLQMVMLLVSLLVTHIMVDIYQMQVVVKVYTDLILLLYTIVNVVNTHVAIHKLY